MSKPNQPSGAERAALRRKKLQKKVGQGVWERYAESVKKGLLTQAEAEAAMKVVRHKEVTQANRARKANGPRPKSNRQRRKEHAEKLAAQDWASRRHTNGHRARRRIDYDDPATYQLNANRRSHR